MAIIGKVLAVALGVTGVSLIAEASYDGLRGFAGETVPTSVTGQALYDGMGAIHRLLAGNANAQGWPAGGVADLSGLVHFGIDGMHATFAPDVSGEPVSTTSIRKIGYGHVSNVLVATTSSGVYSTDGLRSSHVLYPGVTVDNDELPGLLGYHPDMLQAGVGAVGYWKTGFGWLRVPVTGDSFVIQTPLPNDTGSVVHGDFGSCVTTELSTICTD